MPRQQNIAAQENLVESFNSGDIDAAVESFAENVLDHDPVSGQAPGWEGFRQVFQLLKSAFPDAWIEKVHTVATDDHVCFVYTLTGTHLGDCHGVPATGKRIEVRGLQVARFDDGRIIERWGVSDEFRIMQQIGFLTPTDPQAGRAQI